MKETNEKSFLTQEEQQALSLMEDSRKAASDILCEDTSKRSENVKHFRLKNGSYMAAVYEKPVHTLDKATGQLLDMAHRFEEKEDGYEAQTDHFKAHFPKKEGKRQFVTMEKDGRSVSFRYIPAVAGRKRPVAAVQGHERASLLELPRFPHLTYAKTESYADLEYDITEQGVKENLVLTKRPPHTTFRFALKLTGLRVALAEDQKSLQLFADDIAGSDPVFVMPPVYMTDAAGVYSEDAHYALSEDEDGTVLSVVIDPGWLLAEERLYPVTVDPQVVLYQSDNTVSEFVCVRSNGTKQTSGSTLRVGYNKTGVESRLFVGLDFPELPFGSKVTNAFLVLHQASYSGEASYHACRIQQSWDTASISWSNQPMFNASSPCDTLQGQDRLAAEEILLDLTQDVAKRYTYSAFSHYGVAIRISSGCDGDCDENYTDFYTSTAGTTWAPSFRIYYMLVDEYADHQPYESFSAGRAGDGALNLFTGKLSFVHSDIAASGGNLPLNLSHVYRSDFAESGLLGTTYGRGWTLSVAQTLEIFPDDPYVHAVYRDAQGRRHYFREAVTQNCESVYYDSAGLGLTLNGENEITDEKGSTLLFTNGKLTKITDANGKGTHMTYENGLLTKITDGMGRIALLNYTSNRLSSVTDMKGRTTSYSYDSGGGLTQITYPDSTKTVFTYETGTKKKLIRVTDQSGILYDITYDDASDSRVMSVIQKGTKQVAHGSVTSVSAKTGGGMNITYGAASTIVEDALTHLRTVYHLDDCGRATFTYEDLTNNTTLEKGEVTTTDLREYAVVRNHKTNTETTGRYESVKAAIAGTKAMYPNLLSNGSFNASTAGTLQPSGWTASIVSQGSDGVVNESYLTGYHSYRLQNTSSSYSTRRLQQTVSLCDCPTNGNILIASAWAKANNPVNTTFGNSSAKFELYAKLTYEGNTTLERTAKFDCSYTDWQYVAIPLEIPAGTSPLSVQVRFDFSGNTGSCLVSNVRLIQTRGDYAQINYNLSGGETIFGTYQAYNRTIYRYNGLQESLVYINQQSDAVKTVAYNETGCGFSSYAAYDEKHRPIKTMDYHGVVTENTYDDFGNITQQKRYHQNTPSAYLYTRSEYNNTTGRLIRDYDPRYDEVCVSYFYDAQSDLLKQRVETNGQTYTYSHNSQNDWQTAVTALDVTEDSCDISNGFLYNESYLTRITHNGFAYDFAYDELGRSHTVKAAGSTLATHTYTTGEESTVTTTYANGHTSVVTSDSRGNPVKKTLNGNSVFTAEYDEGGNLQKTVDMVKNVCHTYTYNADGSLTLVEERNRFSNTLIGRKTYTYDAGKRPYTRHDSRTGYTYATFYEQTTGGVYPDADVAGVFLTGRYSDTLDRDALRRLSTRQLTLSTASSPLMTATYGYLSQNGHATSFVQSLTHTVGSAQTTLGYTYDRAGNITSVSCGGKKVTYTYDGLNRLVREDNEAVSKRFAYTYDAGGNLMQAQTYALSAGGTAGELLSTDTYTYDTSFKDRLASFNGQAIAYDAAGQPTSYRGKTLTWDASRRMTGYGTNTFAYGADGARYQKNTTTYTLDGATILRETTGTRTLTYFYGVLGDVIGFELSDTSTDGAPASYFYRKNLQGDVVAIYSASGSLVADYTYDAWGRVLSVMNHTSACIGDLNSFRYRSYYYDAETGLYYLQTRYYDPEARRFISPDSLDYLDPDTIQGLNLYAYCLNNPVNLQDPEGNMPNWAKWLIGGVVIAALAVATVATGGAAAGVAGFIVAGALKGAVIGAVSGALVSGTIGGISSAVAGDSFWEGFADGAADGFMSGAIVGGITGAVSSSLQVASAAKSWAATGGKTGFKQMAEHYTRHVIGEGQKAVAKNIVNYTNQASQFFANNNASGYFLRKGVIKIAGAPGGIFNTDGLIRSFWYTLR